MNWTDKVCVASFHTREAAAQAVKDLENLGFDHKQFALLHRDEKAMADGVEEMVGRDHASGAALGAGSGAVMGTVVGAAAAVAFPPAGIIVAAGALLGLAAGAISGGVLGGLTGMGIPKLTVEHYQREIEVGRSVVVVMCEGRAAEVLTVLRNNGGYQLDESGNPPADQPAPADAAVDRDLVGSDGAAAPGAVAATPVPVTTTGTQITSENPTAGSNI